MEEDGSGTPPEPDYPQSEMAGSTTENYVFAGIATVLAIVYLLLAVMNLFGEHLGSKGRRFIFEMDEVMGGLLGIPHYSKLEGGLLLFVAIGLLLSWSYNITTSLVSVLAILTGAVYSLICIFYGIVRGRHNILLFAFPFLMNLAALTALLIWRVVRFLHPRHHVAVGVCGGVEILLSLLSLLVMKLRLARCEPVIVKLLQIQKYEEILKERKESLVWLKNMDAPEGFEAARDGGDLIL